MTVHSLFQVESIQIRKMRSDQKILEDHKTSFRYFCFRGSNLKLQDHSKYTEAFQVKTMANCQHDSSENGHLAAAAFKLLKLKIYRTVRWLLRHHTQTAIQIHSFHNGTYNDGDNTSKVSRHQQTIYIYHTWIQTFVFHQFINSGKNK